MTSRFSKILFYADGAKGELAALRAARVLAEEYGAELTVLGLVDEIGTDNPSLRQSISRIQSSMQSDEEDALDKLISQMSTVEGMSEGVKALAEVGKDYTTVLDVVRREKIDLLVKAADSASAMRAALFGSEDMRLLHYCPCPVLVRKPGRATRIKQVVAAVDTSVKDKSGQALNGEIIEIASNIANLEGADLGVLQVIEPPSVRTSSREKEVLKRLAEQMKEDAERRLDSLLEDHPDVQLTKHQLQGKPSREIPEFVNSQGTDMLVMGSVARSGIQGFVVGNTAEKILNSLDCSVLVLKPPGWSA